MTQYELKYRILDAAPSLSKSGLIQALTGDHQYDVLRAHSPSEALKLAESGPLDLILVDGDDGWISLPDLIIKAKGADSEVPILVFRDPIPKQGDEKIWTFGIDDCIRRPVAPAELLHHVQRALKLHRLGIQCSELTSENQKLYQLAITDGLTKLVNRRYFIERLNAEFARARRFNGRVGVVICDIDFFKKVNDTYGHTVGDRVLKQVSGILSSTVRGIDLAGRYGGEEFVLMLPETAIEGVTFVAEKVRKAIEEFDFSPTDPEDLPGPAHLTISLGCAAYPEIPAEQAQALLEAADQALYRAKQGGRNRVEGA